MSEQWRDVVGYEGLYEVSDCGQVRTVARTIVRRNGRVQPAPQRILRLKPTRQGYWRIGLTKELAGRQEFHFVHRLVLEAFVGPRPEGMECRHLNGDPGNNIVENLCWGTHSENSLDKRRHGTVPPVPNQFLEIRRQQLSKTHCPQGHLYDEFNTYRSKRGQRSCRACNRISARNRRNAS